MIHRAVQRLASVIDARHGRRTFSGGGTGIEEDLLRKNNVIAARSTQGSRKEQLGGRREGKAASIKCDFFVHHHLGVGMPEMDAKRWPLHRSDMSWRPLDILWRVSRHLRHAKARRFAAWPSSREVR